MNTITVEGVDRAIDAGMWLNEQQIEFELTGTGLVSSSTPKYHFKFDDPKDASHFALIWR
jgi:hypothetical protein